MHYNMVKRASRAYLEEIANRAHEMPEVYRMYQYITGDSIYN